MGLPLRRAFTAPQVQTLFIDTAQVVRHVGELFAGEQALIFEFNMFVPEEYRTAAPPGYYRQ